MNCDFFKSKTFISDKKSKMHENIKREQTNAAVFKFEEEIEKKKLENNRIS